MKAFCIPQQWRSVADTLSDPARLPRIRPGPNRGQFPVVVSVTLPLLQHTAETGALRWYPLKPNEIGHAYTGLPVSLTARAGMESPSELRIKEALVCALLFLHESVFSPHHQA